MHHVIIWAQGGPWKFPILTFNSYTFRYFSSPCSNEYFHLIPFSYNPFLSTYPLTSTSKSPQDSRSFYIKTGGLFFCWRPEFLMPNLPRDIHFIKSLSNTNTPLERRKNLSAWYAFIDKRSKFLSISILQQTDIRSLSVTYSIACKFVAVINFVQPSYSST